MLSDGTRFSGLFQAFKSFRGRASRLPSIRAGVLGALALTLALGAVLFWSAPADPALAEDESGRAKITARPVIVSSPAEGDTYGAGERIRVRVRFSDPVTVTGKPRLRLTVGKFGRPARYIGSSKSGLTLYFAYTVKANDRDSDGISISRNQLRLNGGTIVDADGRAANLKHKRLSRRSGHKVDGAPAVEPAQTPVAVPLPESEGDTDTPDPILQRQATNSAAQFAAETASRSVAEGAAAGTSVGDAVTASDDDGDTLTYALSGADAGSFDFDVASGQISVKDALDYERKSSYAVTVSVSDGKNAAGEADSSVDDSIAVTINVTNVDEPGVVSFSANAPLEGVVLEALLIDPDGFASVTSWTWMRSSDGNVWSEIDGESFNSYTPTADDAGQYLRATAFYSDPQGSGKTATGTTSGAVVAQVRLEDLVPEFLPSTASASTGDMHYWLSHGSVVEGGSVTVNARLRKEADSFTGRTIQVSVSPTNCCVVSPTNGQMTIGPWLRLPDQEKLVTIRTKDNKTKNGHQEVTVTVDGQPLKLTVYDDEKTVVQLYTADDIVNEGASPTVRARLQGDALGHDLELTVSVTPGERAKAEDFRLSDNTVLTIPAGQKESTGSVSVTVVENSQVERNKTFFVKAFAGSTGPVWMRAPEPLEFTVWDNDRSRLSLELVPSGTLAEGDHAVVYVRIDQPWHKGGKVTIDLAAGEEFARLYALTHDVTSTTSNCVTSDVCTFTVPADHVGRIGRVGLLAKNDDIDGPDFTYIKLTATHSSLVHATPIRVEIKDNDDHPEVILKLDKSSISENGGTLRVTAELSHPMLFDLNVDVHTSKCGDDPTDICTPQGRAQVVIAGGDTTTTDTVEFRARDNDRDEPDVQVEVTGTIPQHGGGPVKSIRGAVFTIVDDDDPPETVFGPSELDRNYNPVSRTHTPKYKYRLMIDKSTISENGGVATIRAQSQDIVRGALVKITLKAPDDCPCWMSSGFINIEPGSQFGSESVTLYARDNDVRSLVGELTLEVTATASGEGNVRPVTVTIVDDD